MGDIFSPDVQQASTVSGPQGQIQQLVAGQLASLFGGSAMGLRDSALSDLLKGSPGDITAISDAMLRRFDQDIVPRINTSFAGIGGALSSRRGTETTRALGDVQANIGQIQAGLMESARNRQLGALQEVLAPLRIGAAFSTQGTMENIVQPGLGSQLLGLGGTLGGAALLGGGGKGGGGDGINLGVRGTGPYGP